MPRNSWHPGLVLWLILSLLSAATRSEALQYGMRIRPPLTINPAQPSCATCHNSSNTRSDGKRTQTDNSLQLLPDRKRKPVSFYDTKPLTKTQQTAAPIYSEFEKGNPKRGATFFFTQVEPHRFEYRAMFQHDKNVQPNVYGHDKANIFQPFVHDFDGFGKGFPPLPKFPTFPEFPNFFNEPKMKIPSFEYTFPTFPPTVKRMWPPVTELQKPLIPTLEDNLEDPLKNYNIILGDTGYPKIFRFNEERINIEEFDREKKLRFFELAKQRNELLEHENVKRDHLLILHGGIFTVQEPPLFTKHVKKRRKLGGFNSRRLRLYKN